MFISPYFVHSPPAAPFISFQALFFVKWVHSHVDVTHMWDDDQKHLPDKLKLNRRPMCVLCRWFNNLAVAPASAVERKQPVVCKLYLKRSNTVTLEEKRQVGFTWKKYYKD